MEKQEYASKAELEKVAQELIDFLRPKELPVWQAKEALREAIELADWQILK